MVIQSWAKGILLGILATVRARDIKFGLRVPKYHMQIAFTLNIIFFAPW